MAIIRFWNVRRLNQGWSYLLLAALAVVLGIILSHSLQTGEQLWQNNPLLSGGATTVNNRSSRAFSYPAPGLSPTELAKHLQGDANFDAVFVTAPAEVNPGLGPLFNNPSCNGCHLQDGRGMPRPGQSLVRVSLANGKAEEPGGAVPVPVMGTQLQDSAIAGFKPEAKVVVTWHKQEGQYRDGTPYALRSPAVKLVQTDPNIPIPPETQISLRVPPAVFGTGLLEAVPEAEIVQQADPEDRNGDGISGRPNYVWHPIEKRNTLGRFGLKANTPDLTVQTAAAYINDMGVTNPIFPGNDPNPDIDRQILDNTIFYVQTLGVPARTLDKDKQVRRGEKLFAQANCVGCHVATLHTGSAKSSVLAHQTIHPYSDLLLHDMGEALADHRPDFQASGSEWRTAPLWGLGLVQTVLPYSGYLHDGRARTLEEAILWHGGEAQASKTAFLTMAKGDREALLKFLNSL